MTDLFTPLQVGALDVPNRVFMAPMTRARGSREHVPTPRMADYYAQRASAGLIISEAIGISREGLGWPYATGLWRPEQIEGWRKVTDAVHANDGRIVAQLWHMGRTVHPNFLGGAQPVGASVTTAPGQAHTYEGRQPYACARALEAAAIPALLSDFQRAAEHALSAGFDGVQIHAANGYLIDEFLRDGANHRTDDYGGAIENRMRLLLEVTAAVIAVAGAERTGVRLSPNGETQGVRDSDPLSLYRTVVRALAGLRIAHLELREPPQNGSFGVGEMPPLIAHLRPHFSGILIANSDIDQDQAYALIRVGTADAVSFGRPFIANPDLPERFRHRLPLTRDDPSTWFTQTDQGYIDYPRHAEVADA